MALRKFSNWLLNEVEVPPAVETPPTYPNPTQQITDAAKQNQAKSMFDKFMAQAEKLPAPQWEFYINQLVKTYETKFKKNFSAVASIAKGTSSNIQAAQNKLDKQQMSVPAMGGANNAGK